MSTAMLAQPAVAATIVSVGDDEFYEIIDGQRVRTPPMVRIRGLDGISTCKISR